MKSFTTRELSLELLCPKPYKSFSETFEWARFSHHIQNEQFPFTLSGHLNGVNVIGLSLQQTVPAISAPGLRPPIINQPPGDFSSLQMHLQPRRPTTGTVDFLLPLQPELLLGNL